MTTEKIDRPTLGRLFDFELLIIRGRSDKGETEYAARDRHILLDHIDILRSELTEARLTAEEAWDARDEKEQA